MVYEHQIIPNDLEVHPQVKKLLKIPQYEQRSPEWFKQREGKLTSSDLDSVLGNSKYSSSLDVLFKKCGVRPEFKDNPATLHGKKYEDEAIGVYCKMTKKKTFSFGLLPHPYVEWLGGSPDDITHDGIVVEVKCPLTRKIVHGEIPGHYISQLKMNMEICGLDKGVFIEYVPECLTGTGMFEMNVVYLNRDPEWFKAVLPPLREFWEGVVKYRARGISHHPDYDVMVRKVRGVNSEILDKTKRRYVGCETSSSSEASSDDEPG